MNTVGGFFHIDTKTGEGYYMSDEDIALAGGGLAMGIGVLAVYYMIIFAITIVVFAPFFTLFFLDDFIETFVANNALFFTVCGIFLVLLKLNPVISGRAMVRILFDLYIVIAVLYVTLYILRLDIPIYSYFQIWHKLVPKSDSLFVDIWGSDNILLASESWFYGIAEGCTVKLCEFVKWALTNIGNIDNSCFHVPAGEMDIIAVLLVAGKYVLYSAAAAIVTIIWAALMLVVVVVTVVLPYAVALVAIIFVNKLIFKISTARILSITQGKAYEEALRICHTEVNPLCDSSRRIYMPQEKVLEICERAAKAGNPRAQLLYADILMAGNGVPVNRKQAVHWYKKAALTGDTLGQIAMARVCYDGVGTAKSKALAKAWLTVAFRDGETVERYAGIGDNLYTLVEIAKKTKWIDCF